MLSKRFIIETINDQLKNISYICHSAHNLEIKYRVFIEQYVHSLIT
jgi:hypothetical protein